jgi:membrane-associated two-gene conflict system component 1 (EACC1)
MMQHQQARTQSPVQFALSTAEAELDPNSQAWDDAIQALVDDLKSAGAVVRSAPVANVTCATTKGALMDLLVTLSKSGALELALGVVVAWVKHSRKRTITLTRTSSDGRTTKLRLESSSASEQLLTEFLKSTVDRPQE